MCDMAEWQWQPRRLDDNSTDSDGLPNGELQYEHFVVWFFVFWGIIICYVVIKNWRIRLLTVYLRRFPRSRLGIGKGDLPPKVYAVVVNQLYRATAPQTKIEPNPEDCADKGWGTPKTDMESVHFKTAIAYSYRILEDAASFKNPKSKLAPGETIREYVQKLKQSITGGDANTSVFHQLCDEYVNMYERARFSAEEVDFTEYCDFMRKFLYLVQHFEFSETLSRSLHHPSGHNSITNNNNGGVHHLIDANSIPSAAAVGSISNGYGGSHVESRHGKRVKMTTTTAGSKYTSTANATVTERLKSPDRKPPTAKIPIQQRFTSIFSHHSDKKRNTSSTIHPV
eukprot:GILJ01010842.1.p1 GENE.GILJ01010842.1~~GILJ01010842.1.p1  ORF type:complete len:340 (+),score=45.50 GILJ01010842.1:110-1129(+)